MSIEAAICGTVLAGLAADSAHLSPSALVLGAMGPNWGWFGNLREMLPAPASGLACTLAAVLGGGLVGIERERREKPAGVRTMVLICLGAVIYTEAGLLLAPESTDRSRVAAQVVSGIGFLGAGAIIQQGGLVVGVTTGAAIWAVAAIGLVIGAGYAAAGLAFSLIVFFMLSGIGWLERRLAGECEWSQVQVTYRRDGGKTLALIEDVLEEFVATFSVAPHAMDGEIERVVIRFCSRHKHHRALVAQLAGLSNVLQIEDPGVVGK